MEASNFPTRDLELVSTAEQIRSATSSALAAVRFYYAEQEERWYLIYSVIPKPINTTSYLLQFVERDIGKMSPMVQMDVINSLDLSHPGSEPHASVILTMSDEIRNIIYDEFYAYSDPRFDPIRTWMIVARLLRAHGNILYAKPKTITYHEPYVVERVDLDQFSFRNLNSLSELISYPKEKLEFMNMLRGQFVETMNEGIPEHETLYTSRTHWGSENANYATYKIPVFDIEKYVIESAHKHFSQLYVHPIEMVEMFRNMETDLTRISSDTIVRAHSANRNVRVPKPLVYTVAVEEYYDSLMSMKELYTQIDSMLKIFMALRNMAAELTALQRALRVSSGVTSGVDSLGSCINTSGLGKIIETIFRTNINPNLYYVHINDISWETWRNPLFFISLKTLLSMIPATALLPNQRRAINNLIAVNIFYHKLDTTLYQRLSDRVFADGDIRLPPVTARGEWANDVRDLLQIAYYHGHTVLITRPFEKVHRLIRLWFNDVDHIVNQNIVNLPGGNVEHMSLCTPYYTGVSPINYARDREYDNFREARHMHPNGVLLMNPVTDYLQAADATIIRRIIEFTSEFYTGTRTTGTGLTPEQLTILTSHIETLGVERVLVIPRAFNSMRPTFSTSIAADGIIRSVPAMRRRHLTIDSKYLVTGFLMIDAGLEFKPEATMRLYGGTHIAYTMQMFKTLYHEIQRRCGLVVGDYVTQSQLCIVTTALMKIFFETPDFDPKELFGYEDAGQWKTFLESPSVPIGDIPVLKNFLELIGRVEPLLQSEYLQETIVNRFFLVKGVYSKVDDVILATNSIKRSRMHIVKHIRSAQSYHDLKCTYVKEGPEGGTLFDKYWYYDVSSVDPDTQYSRDDIRIPVIRVEMRARVITKVVYEDGSFPISSPEPGSTIDDFEIFMKEAIKSPTQAKMLTIKHTVIINNIGSHSRPNVMPLARIRESVISRLPKLSMVVPLNNLRLNLISLPELVRRLNNSVTFRKDAYVLWNDFQVQVSRAYQPR